MTLSGLRVHHVFAKVSEATGNRSQISWPLDPFTTNKHHLITNNRQHKVMGLVPPKATHRLFALNLCPRDQWYRSHRSGSPTQPITSANPSPSDLANFTKVLTMLVPNGPTWPLFQCCCQPGKMGHLMDSNDSSGHLKSETSQVAWPKGNNSGNITRSCRVQCPFGMFQS